MSSNSKYKKELLSTTTKFIPLTAINNPNYQSMFTTYPTRMRLGTTSLMQPNYLAGKDSNLSQSNGNLKRSRTAVNYAEMEANGAGEDSDEDSMESDSARQHRKKYIPTPSLGAALHRKQFESAGHQSVETIEEANWGDGKSYLGVTPPANLILVQKANTTRHIYA